MSTPDSVINLREGIIWRGSEWNLEAAASCGLQCSETHQLLLRLLNTPIHTSTHQLPSIRQLFPPFQPLLSPCLAVGKRVRFCPFLSFSSSEDMSLNFNVGEYEYHGKAKRKCKSSSDNSKQNISKTWLSQPSSPDSPPVESDARRSDSDLYRFGLFQNTF